MIDYFETYQDNYAMPPCWRFRGVVVDDLGTSREKARIVLVTWWEYETQEAAVKGALDLVEFLQDGGRRWKEQDGRLI